jgi:NAD(P)-dependent dehydrogenase (short-subunit alcohol dehydrogenase family)
MGRVQDKRVLFVGTGSNIGRAAVEALVAEGARVTVGDIDVENGERLASEIGDRVRFIRCDATKADDVARLAASAAEWLGGLDALCQNVGVQYAGFISDFSVEDWDRTFAVNVRSQFLGAKYALPHLQAAGGGSIVNMASAAGFRAGPGSTAYGASKGAVITFTRTLAVELAPHRIRVNAICPGWVDTPFNQRVVDLMGGREAQRQSVEAGVPLKRQGAPREVAPMFVYLVSDESAYMTGQALAIDGGIST